MYGLLSGQPSAKPPTKRPGQFETVLLCRWIFRTVSCGVHPDCRRGDQMRFEKPRRNSKPVVSSNSGRHVLWPYMKCMDWHARVARHSRNTTFKRGSINGAVSRWRSNRAKTKAAEVSLPVYVSRGGDGVDTALSAFVSIDHARALASPVNESCCLRHSKSALAPVRHRQTPNKPFNVVQTPSSAVSSVNHSVCRSSNPNNGI